MLCAKLASCYNHISAWLSLCRKASCDFPHWGSTVALGPARAPGRAWGVETLGRRSPNVLPLPSWDGGTLFSAGCGGFWHWGHCCCSQALALGLGLVSPCSWRLPWDSGSGPGETHRNNLETCSAELSLTAKLNGSSGRLDLCFLQWFSKTTVGNPTLVSVTLKKVPNKRDLF